MTVGLSTFASKFTFPVTPQKVFGQLIVDPTQIGGTSGLSQNDDGTYEHFKLSRAILTNEGSRSPVSNPGAHVELFSILQFLDLGKKIQD